MTEFSWAVDWIRLLKWPVSSVILLCKRKIDSLFSVFVQLSFLLLSWCKLRWGHQILLNMNSYTLHSKRVMDFSKFRKRKDIWGKIKSHQILHETSPIFGLDRYNLANPVWSCIWNTDDRNFFYAGQANGNVVEFDIRNTSEHVQELNTEGIRSPVVSLQYIPKDIQTSFRYNSIQYD